MEKERSNVPKKKIHNGSVHEVNGDRGKEIAEVKCPHQANGTRTPQRPGIGRPFLGIIYEGSLRDRLTGCSRTGRKGITGAEGGSGRHEGERDGGETGEKKDANVEKGGGIRRAVHRSY